MNILFITQLFPFDEEAKNTSGALREFIEEWGRNGHQVKVIRPHFRYEKEPFPEVPRFRIGDHVDVEFIRPFRIPLLKLSWYNHKKIIKKLQMKPDVVICHLYNSYFTFRTLAGKLHVPLIIGIHMSDTRIAGNRFHHRHQRRVFKYASAFACRSHACLKSFINLFPEHSDHAFLALSGIPGKYLMNRRENFTPGTKKIISVARLIKRKQIDLVLKILSRLPSDIDWEYVVIGSGAEEEPLKKICHDLGIAAKVVFMGAQSRDVIIERLRESDVFILPSYQETFGLVYLEAMACGCITIGGLHEGIDGIIKDGENGFLCEVMSEESIKEKLLQSIMLSEHQRKKMVNESFQTIQEFSVTARAREYLQNVNKYIS